MVRKKIIYSEIKKNTEEILSLGTYDYSRLSVLMRKRERLFHSLRVAHTLCLPEAWEAELADGIISDSVRIERLIMSMKEALGNRMRKMESDAKKISEYGKF